MKAVILLADGFEEIEALAPADIWRRLNMDVVLAGVTGETVTGSHGIPVKTDIRFSPVLKAGSFDILYCPGGLPGATNLRDNPDVIRLVQESFRSGKITAAICAAPIVLEKAGITAGKEVTGYPGSERLASGPLTYTGNRTEADGNLLTGIGPGAAMELAFRIAEKAGVPASDLAKLKQGMFLLP